MLSVYKVNCQRGRLNFSRRTLTLCYLMEGLNQGSIVDPMITEHCGWPSRHIPVTLSSKTVHEEESCHSTMSCGCMIHLQVFSVCKLHNRFCVVCNDGQIWSTNSLDLLG